MGHYKEILQVFTNESSSKIWDFTTAMSKTLGSKGQLENLIKVPKWLHVTRLKQQWWLCVVIFSAAVEH